MSGGRVYPVIFSGAVRSLVTTPWKVMIVMAASRACAAADACSTGRACAAADASSAGRACSAAGARAAVGASSTTSTAAASWGVGP